MYPRIQSHIFSAIEVWPKISPLQNWAKIFLCGDWRRIFFKEGKGLSMKRLTEREWTWLWEFTRTGSNASQAAKVAYGGTPISVRVKGHNKKVKLKPFLDRVDRIWDQFLV